MVVDCDQCEVRGDACQDCVITVLLGAPPSGVDLNGVERRALRTLADAGIVPHLQLVNRREDRDTTQTVTDTNVHPRGDAERPAANGERPVRHVS
jgi:hypothetical protein